MFRVRLSEGEAVQGTLCFLLRGLLLCSRQMTGVGGFLGAFYSVCMSDN